MPVFKKFVQLGRVVHVTKGISKGKLGAIVDIIDVNRLLVHGPDMRCQEVKLRDCYVTTILLKVPHRMPEKFLMKRWAKSLVEKRFARSVHAQRLAKLEKRKQITDFGYFKVRTAQRSSNKVVDHAFKTLRSNNPRTMGKFEKNRQRLMAFKLGYKKPKKLTEAQKKVKYARRIVKTENRKVKNSEKYAVKKAKKIKDREARKDILAKKTAAGKLPAREFVPKDKRVTNPKRHPSTPYVRAEKERRRQRDVARKTLKSKNRTETQAVMANVAARKVARLAGQPVPAKVVFKKRPVKKIPQKKKKAKAE